MIKKIKIKNQKGFTILELMVSVFIFAMMTALLLSKYGNFNQGILLTNLAYDVALTLRNAQTYGLNVKSITRDSNQFDYPYGVHFQKQSTSFIFFADSDSDGLYDGQGENIGEPTIIKRGSKIGRICRDSDCVSDPTGSLTELDITFKRPEPNAIIMGDGDPAQYAEITVEATDGTTKKVIVRSTGQIAVID